MKRCLYELICEKRASIEYSTLKKEGALAFAELRRDATARADEWTLEAINEEIADCRADCRARRVR